MDVILDTWRILGVCGTPTGKHLVHLGVWVLNFSSEVQEEAAGGIRVNGRSGSRRQERLG